MEAIAASVFNGLHSDPKYHQPWTSHLEGYIPHTSCSRCQTAMSDMDCDSRKTDRYQPQRPEQRKHTSPQEYMGIVPENDGNQYRSIIISSNNCWEDKQPVVDLLSRASFLVFDVLKTFRKTDRRETDWFRPSSPSSLFSFSLQFHRQMTQFNFAWSVLSKNNPCWFKLT